MVPLDIAAGHPIAPAEPAVPGLRNAPAPSGRRLDIRGRAPAGEVSLPAAVRAVLPPPGPGERYHVRGLTELWAREVGKDSEHTRRSYTYALSRWLDYCLRAGLDPLAARRADVDDWITHLGTANPETVNARLAGVRSWYRYLISNDLEIRDPVGYVRRPRRQRGAPKTAFLDQDGLNALLRAAARRAERATGGPRAEIAVRDLAVLSIFATTAVRSAAVQRAQVGDVCAELAGHRVLRYRAKGGADRYKPLVPYAVAAVDRYLRLRAARLGVRPDQLTGLAFVTAPYQGRPGGTGLTSGALQKMIRSVATEAGLANADKLVPHSIRHTVATLLAGHRPLHEVQDFLDHADPRTTRTYVHADETLNNSPAYTAAGLLRTE